MSPDRDIDRQPGQSGDEEPQMDFMDRFSTSYPPEITTQEGLERFINQLRGIRVGQLRHPIYLHVKIGDYAPDYGDPLAELLHPKK